MKHDKFVEKVDFITFRDPIRISHTDPDPAWQIESGSNWIRIRNTAYTGTYLQPCIYSSTGTRRIKHADDLSKADATI